MTDDDHADDEAAETYDPSSPTAPARTPPLRSTAPQSEYTMGQVAFGFVVLLLGLAIVFGLPVAMA
jgi:hypothetical protein